MRQAHINKDLLQFNEIVKIELSIGYIESSLKNEISNRFTYFCYCIGFL